ncbi:MAG TPA: hypothetical protein VLQ67_14045 [Arachnia sp.]|nr:hypothetical protein [Arachnia sp.]
MCGTITVPLATLRPKLELAVHLHADAVGHLTGAARIEGAGHITTALLAELLPGVEVSVQPVIDLPEMAAEDRYVPSVRLKKAILIALDRELFPYSTRRSKGLDVDHTEPYTPGRPGADTDRQHRAPGAGDPSREDCGVLARPATQTLSALLGQPTGLPLRSHPLVAPACSPRRGLG